MIYIAQAAQRPDEVATVSAPSRLMLRSRVRCLDLWSGKASCCGQRGPQCNLHLKLAAQLLIGGRAVSEHIEGRGQMTYRFPVRRSANRQLSGLLAKVDSPIGKPGRG